MRKAVRRQFDMKTGTKAILAIGTLTVLMVVFLYGTQSYFHDKEIKFASEGCYQIGGTPIVEKDFWALGYSFSCKVND